MNIMKAFMLGTAGIMTDYHMQNYQNLVYDNYQTVKQSGSFLSEFADRKFNDFKDFVSSRAWELSAKLTGGGNSHVGEWDIGYLGTLEDLQNAGTIMRDYIMSMPGMMTHYENNDISGYGGNFSNWCFGEGDENFYYRRQMDGVLTSKSDGDHTKYYHKHYKDTVGSLSGLSVNERMMLSETRLVVNKLMASKTLDVTSTENRPFAYKPEEQTEIEV